MTDTLLEFFDKLTRLNQLVHTTDETTMWEQYCEVNTVLAPYGYILILASFDTRKCFVTVASVQERSTQALSHRDAEIIAAANGQDKSDDYKMGVLDGYKQCVHDSEHGRILGSFDMHMSAKNMTRTFMETLLLSQERAIDYTNGYISGYAVCRGEERRKHDAT